MAGVEVADEEDRGVRRPFVEPDAVVGAERRAEGAVDATVGPPGVEARLGVEPGRDLGEPAAVAVALGLVAGGEVVRV